MTPRYFTRPGGYTSGAAYERYIDGDAPGELPVMVWRDGAQQPLRWPPLRTATELVAMGELIEITAEHAALLLDAPAPPASESLT